jgi:hypothetical protein
MSYREEDEGCSGCLEEGGRHCLDIGCGTLYMGLCAVMALLSADRIQSGTELNKDEVPRLNFGPCGGEGGVVRGPHQRANGNMSLIDSPRT